MGGMKACGFPVRALAPLAIFVLAAMFASPRATGQSPGAAGTSKLESVRVTGSTRFRSEQIAPVTGLSPGATISKDDLQQGADRLVRLGLFATVQYRYATVETGVRAEYQVTDAPTMPVWFDNFPWFTDDELIAALKRDVPLFDGTAPQQGAILDDLSATLERFLLVHGVQASVSHTLATTPTDNQQVQSFRAENSGLNIAGIEFSDPLAQSDRGIQQRLPDLVGQPYSRSRVELFEFEQVRPVYISHAFLHVKFGTPVPRLTGNGANARVTIAASVESGPAYTWNDVNWRGDWAVSPADLDKLLGLKPGDPADGSKLEAAWQSARDEYAHRGYLDADLAPAPQLDDAAKRVTYTVTVTEGPQYHMGQLVLTGLSMDGERRVRAAWKIPEGAVFDKSAYENFLSAGVQQAFAGLPFHYEKIGRFLQQDPIKATVDVMLDFQ